MISLKVVKAPAAEPVDLEVVKNHLKQESTVDDDLIQLYLTAAREAVENFTRRVFINTQFMLALDGFPPYWCGWQEDRYWYPRSTRWGVPGIRLRGAPLVSVDRIEYVDVNGTTQTLEPTLDSWQANTQVSVGYQIKDPNGNIQQVDSITESDSGDEQVAATGASEPTFSNSVNAITADGPVNWKNKGSALTAGFTVDESEEPAVIYPLLNQTWPAYTPGFEAVKIFHTLGYGTDGAQVPARAKVAILHGAANFYENRNTVTQQDLKKIPEHTENLLWSLRVVNDSGAGC